MSFTAACYQRQVFRYPISSALYVAFNPTVHQTWRAPSDINVMYVLYDVV